MEDVSLMLKTDPTHDDHLRRHRGFFSALIALLMPLTIVATVTLAAALAAAGTSEPAASAAKPAGELRIAMAGIGVMRPIPWQETPFSKGYLTLLYDFLVGANPDGSLSTANGAAETWEMSPDGMTWTFSIRKGITFHDGTELTAEDVKWSLEIAPSQSRLRPMRLACAILSKRSR